MAIFILIPLVGLLVSLLLPAKNEKLISGTAFLTAGLQLLSTLCFAVYWAVSRFPRLNTKELSLYTTGNYEFFVDLYFDKVTATYLLVGAILTFLIVTYSRYYLHREKGYKRFFNTILLFFLGYNITIFSGNFETLFIGWEILGVSSFLLIAFYRDRYLPVRNAYKVFSIYRLGDIGMILAMWMSHHLWHHNVTFAELNNYAVVDHVVNNHLYLGVFISLMILLSAAVKSAQVPFSSWLPRAMEGPTPSSAIFYGSLAVHMGAFMLLRTIEFWDHMIWIRVLIGLLGAATALSATFSGRVQSSIKSQIAYSSVAQLGIIFIEIALGLEVLALVHFASNAFLRSYQLLVSPSVVTYLIREKFFNYLPDTEKTDPLWLKRLKYSIYIYSVREWNLDSLMFRYLWNPFKKAGKLFSFMGLKTALGLIPVFVAGVFLYHNQAFLPPMVLAYLPTAFAFVGLLLIIRAFAERQRPITSWLLIGFGHFWTALAVLFNEAFDYSHTAIYLGGVVVSGILGLVALRLLLQKEPGTTLDRFHGHSFEHNKLSILFLLSCLGMAGFPITTTFLGEDLLYSHIHVDQFFLALFVSMGFVFNGLALMRMYARLFLGPHVKTYHEVALRSS